LGNSTTSYAYLKIAEGCNNHCTYCIIPQLRGNIRSRDLDSLVEEATMLVGQGKKEIILVAQDTTKYGIDLYEKKMLPELIQRLCRIEGLEWLRLLYCYPEDITDELIQVMRQE
jgi:ribosomal protein S12 methylthiotransferase